MFKTVIQEIAITFFAWENCRKQSSENAQKWMRAHRESIESLVKDRLPSGSGIDNGTVFCFDRSRIDRLVFSCDFHHMNDDGVYVKWTTHSVIATPSLIGTCDTRVTGINYRGIKEYLHDEYQNAFTCLV